MQKNKNTTVSKKPQVIVSIPSLFLPAISASGSITGFTNPDKQTYDFAQRVNKICCDFFRENMIVDDLVFQVLRNPNNPDSATNFSVYGKRAVESDFFKFNQKVVCHFLSRVTTELYGAFYDERLPLTETVCDILDECNSIKYSRDLFDMARNFYRSICLRMPMGRDIELRKKMEELFNLLYGRSFPVYIVFDATRSRLLDRDWGYEVDPHSYSICKERFEKLNKGDADIGFFNSYSNMQAFENFRRAQKDEKWGMAVTLADTVINHDVTIPVSQARFFVRDDATSDKFALKQMKLSEVLTKQVQENEDF